MPLTTLLEGLAMGVMWEQACVAKMVRIVTRVVL